MESKEISSLARPKGVLAAVLTPMDEDLKPDLQAFAAHCQRLLAAGCHGLSVFGTTGEANSLSVNERLAALEGLVDSGVPVETLLPGTGSCALTDTSTPEPRGARGWGRGCARAAAVLLQGRR